jgi:hypothetical protein
MGRTSRPATEERSMKPRPTLEALVFGARSAAGERPPWRAWLARPATRARWRRALTWAFTFFNTARVLSYLPTLWVIAEQGDSSQYSLVTWFTWLGANLTMAAWIHEHNGRRLDCAVILNLANAAMCTTTAALILWLRF